MTEGIIQKVFKKYFKKSGLNKSPHAGELHWTQLCDMENELIEEIKLISTISYFGCGITKNELLKKLIGDTE